MIIIFFGPPGSGKGTQASLLATKLNLPHISTGDILRKKTKETDEISNELNTILSKGHLVSDEILNNIISRELLTSKCEKGFLLDGYPRTKQQSEFLISFFENNYLELNFVFNFNINISTIEQRIANRSTIEKRSDDSLNVVKTRIEKYNCETKPLSSVYMKKYPKIFIEIDADQEINKIHSDLVNYIKNGNF